MMTSIVLTDGGGCFIVVPIDSISTVQEIVPVVSEMGFILRSMVYLKGDPSPFIVSESVEEILNGQVC